MDGLNLPAGSCDCHAHVFGPFDQFPLAADRRYTPLPATATDYLAMLDATGMQRGVLVQASAAGWDSRGTLAALRAGQGRLRGVAVPRPEVSDQELADLHAAGVRAIRFMQQRDRSAEPPRSGIHALERLAQFAPRLRALGWHAQIYANCSLIAEHAPLLRTLGLPLVVDHLCCVDPTRGVADASFQTVLGLVRDGIAAVKLTAYRHSQQSARYDDIRPFHDALVAANTAQLLWGSDWPFVDLPPERTPTVESVTRVFCDWVRDAALRRRILVDNPARIYGFS